MRIAIATNDGIHVNRCELQDTKWNIYEIDDRTLFLSTRYILAKCDQRCETCARLLSMHLSDCDIIVVSHVDPRIPFLLRRTGMQVISNISKVECAINNIQNAQQRNVSSDYYRKVAQYLQ